MASAATMIAPEQQADAPQLPAALGAAGVDLLLLETGEPSFVLALSLLAGHGGQP